jgi:hypothetical protein
MTHTAETKRYRVYLHETSGNHAAWSRTVRAVDRYEAVEKALRAWFGARAFFFESQGLRNGGTRAYGQVFRRPRAGSSSGTASSSATTMCSLDVDEV